MPIGLLDLSLVTQRLITQLTDAKTDTQLWTEDTSTQEFTIDFTGLAPDAVRSLTTHEVDCHVSVYLFHVAADKHHRNTFPRGGRAQPTPPQPFALTLYYLLTAYSSTSHVHEQQAMSIALKCFHENPVVTITIPVDKHEEAFTLTIEPQTVDEIGRLWQAINAPMRLSAVYRVGVVFIEEPLPEAPKVVRHDPVVLVQPLPTMPEEGGAATDATGLATIELPGAELDAQLAEVKIRARPLKRVDGPPLGGQFQIKDASTMVLCLPLYTPDGRYLVSVTPSPKKAPLTFSLDVPARIVFVGVDDTGLAAFAADDAGFPTGATEVRFGVNRTPLTETSNDPPDAGKFFLFRGIEIPGITIPPGNNALRLRVPAGTPKGLHFLSVKRGTRKPDFGLWLEVPPP